MPKPKHSDVDKECPICGGIIWGKSQRVLIEGAVVTVCLSCAQYGKKIISKVRSPVQKRLASNNSNFSPRRHSTPKSDFLKPSHEIVSNYSERIRKARNVKKLTQDQFAQKLNEKPSLIRRIEAGKAEPTIKLAKKIEKVYNIKLIKDVDERETDISESKYLKRSKNSSLGDIAFIKKSRK